MIQPAGDIHAEPSGERHAERHIEPHTERHTGSHAERGAVGTLELLPVGQRAVIRDVADPTARRGGAPDSALLRLRELGMTPSTEVVVTRRGIGGDPLEVEVRGTRVCLRRGHAACFRVANAPAGRP